MPYIPPELRYQIASYVPQDMNQSIGTTLSVGDIIVDKLYTLGINPYQLIQDTEDRFKELELIGKDFLIPNLWGLLFAESCVISLADNKVVFHSVSHNNFPYEQIQELIDKDGRFAIEMPYRGMHSSVVLSGSKPHLEWLFKSMTLWNNWHGNGEYTRYKSENKNVNHSQNNH